MRGKFHRMSALRKTRDSLLAVFTNTDCTVDSQFQMLKVNYLIQMTNFFQWSKLLNYEFLSIRPYILSPNVFCSVFLASSRFNDFTYVLD